MELKEYRAKRNFKITPEPPGEGKPVDQEPLRFVVHEHHASRLHWDLRLELDGALKSWAVPKGPTLDPQGKRLAVMVEDHPLDYQAFEGVIPEGNYGAGPVMIWDRGNYHALGFADRRSSEEALRKGLDKGHITFILDGYRLRGEFALVKLKKGQENSWLLFKKNDAFADSSFKADFESSVASGRTMEEIARNVPDLTGIDLTGAPEGPMPTRVEPMLATLVDKAFDRSGWLFEIKWDGYRALAESQGGRVRLRSRHDQDLSDQFTPVIESLEQLPFDVLLDGEIVVVDQTGKASFTLLQDYLQSGQGNLVYYVFDLLYFRGYDLRSMPLVRRKAALRHILPRLPHVRLSDHIETEGLSLFALAVKNDIEGIVAKDGQSPYRSGQRGREWLKVKTKHTQEAVIGGFTEPRGGGKGLGALVLGLPRGGRLTYIGHAGGGILTDEQRRALLHRLEALTTRNSPFETTPETNAEATWVEPILVCEVRFSGWTKEGLMRHPVLLGLREDKDPTQVGRETAEPVPTNVVASTSGIEKTTPDTRRRRGLVSIADAKVHLTNLDKVFWPTEGYTKGDVIDYYREVASFILPYLKDRPESLHRFPDGITGEAFFQKNVDSHVPNWVRTAIIPSESEHRDTTYLLCQDEASLIYLANLGCIELNPWHSRIGHLDYPDFMVLDLDPLDVSFDEVVRAAIATHQVLKEIGAEGFCKTSGATGLHVYVPLGAQYSYDEVTRFAKLVNLLVHSRLPDSTSVERTPEKRHGKVYLDFLQNRFGQTVAAPYCLRPRPGAPASTPLDWNEVDTTLDPTRLTIKTIPGRLRRVGDIWEGVLGSGIEMEECLARIEEVFLK